MAVKNGLTPIHPGEFLAEILEEIGVSQSEFSRRIGVSRMRISHIVNGQRPVTAEMAHLIGKAFGQTPKYWMNLQASYDLKIAERSLKDQISRIHRLEPATA
jgi:addiction module HigA family antidote